MTDFLGADVADKPSESSIDSHENVIPAPLPTCLENMRLPAHYLDRLAVRAHNDAEPGHVYSEKAHVTSVDLRLDVSASCQELPSNCVQFRPGRRDKLGLFRRFV